MNKDEHIKAREIALKLLEQLESENVSYKMAHHVIDIMAAILSDDSNVNLSTTLYSHPSYPRDSHMPEHMNQK